MKRNRPAVAALAALFAACSGGDGPTDPPPPTVSSVTVSPATHTLDMGATVQFTATAKDASGATVSGQTVTWSSSSTAVASISTSGLATGVAAGSTAITATVGGVAGSAVLTVTQSLCAGAKTVSLSAGQSASYAAADCLMVPSGASGDRYRVAILRPAESGSASDVVTATLKVVGVGVTGQAAPEPAAAAAAGHRLEDLPGYPARNLARSRALAQSRARAHAALFEREARFAEEVLRNARGARVVAAPRPTLALRAPALASPATKTFDVSSGGCSSTPDLKTGKLVWENEDVVFYQDSAQAATDAAPVNLVQQIGNFFTAHGKPAVEQYFAEVPDIDEDGKLTVLITPVVTDSVAAFVSLLDVFTKSSCATSNEMDLVYFGLHHIKDMAEENFQALGTLAHEARHVVTAYHRAVASNMTNVSQYNPTWIEEGTAEIADEMASRFAWASIGGPAVNALIDRQSFVNQAGNFVPENYGVLLHVGRAGGYLSSQPNALVTKPTGGGPLIDVYGSGWTFHRWLGDSHGKAGSAPKADATLFRALNDSLTPGGVAGLAQQTGKPFLTLLDEFVVGNALHGTTAPQGSLGYTTYDFPSAGSVFCGIWNPVGDFPFPVTTTGTPRDCDGGVAETSNPSKSFSSATYSGPIGITGMRIHDFVSNGTGTGAQITVEGVAAPGKIIVVRIR